MCQAFEAAGETVLMPSVRLECKKLTDDDTRVAPFKGSRMTGEVVNCGFNPTSRQFVKQISIVVFPGDREDLYYTMGQSRKSERGLAAPRPRGHHFIEIAL